MKKKTPVTKQNKYIFRLRKHASTRYSYDNNGYEPVKKKQNKRIQTNKMLTQRILFAKSQAKKISTFTVKMHEIE